MSATIRTNSQISHHLGDLAKGVVFQQNDVDDDWTSVANELRAVFDVTKPASVEEVPAVYIVSSDALLGRTGPGNAMVATGILSAARTLAAEMKRSGIPVNVLGAGPDASPSVIAAWVVRLLEPGGPTGELVQLDGTQIGKALP